MTGASRPRGSVWLALVAAMAMLWSAALPAYAVGVEKIEICSAHGDRTLFVAADAGTTQDGAPCQHCGHCTLAAPVMAPDISVFAQPVRYAAFAESQAVKVTTTPKSARAPPRPPSHAPPSSLIA